MACLSGQSNDFSHKFALVCRRSSSVFEKKKYINTKACPCDRIFRGAIFLPAFMHYSSGGGNWVDRRCRINKWTAVRSKWNVVHRGDKWWGEWSRIFPVLHFRDTADDKERRGGGGRWMFFLASNHNFTRWRKIILKLLFGSSNRCESFTDDETRPRNIRLDDSKIREIISNSLPLVSKCFINFFWNYDHRYSILNEKNIVDWQHFI